MRLLTYNIRYGGVGRAGALASVVNACRPDLVVLQEATQPDVVGRLADATGMVHWAAHPNRSVGFLSRRPVEHYQWHRPASSRRAYLEIVPGGGAPRVFGVHLSAVHSNWTERRRVRELKAVLTGIQHHQDGFHVIAGDFNTLAPGETLDVGKLPPRLRAVVWLTGRQIRWETIKIMLDRSYVDAYRSLHPREAGHTFLAGDPHVRLDYVFLPLAFAARLRACDVFTHPAVTAASDHLPVVAELDLS